VAELYERSRPGYPDAALARLVSALSLAPGCLVVDLAAGTGKLTRSLLATGARVVAVEPLAEMRAILTQKAPGAEVLDGRAEDLPLPDESADAVAVGQAFHWFDPARAVPEIARVLRPGGALALMWNIRDLGHPLQSELQELIAPYRRRAPSEHEQPWRAVFAASRQFGPEEMSSFPWVQSYTVDELIDRFGSVSFIAALDEGERAALLGRVRELAGGLEEPFDFPYRTDVYVYRRLSPASGRAKAGSDPAT
jgi:SAM-dependent methyltransferase